MKREINDIDIDMFYQLERLKEKSLCIDKQVACIIADRAGNILASGVNTVIECDKNCHDKKNRTCRVQHAEIRALEALDKSSGVKEERVAYVSLFPCAACQEAVYPYVNEIVTFGMIHKDWISGDALTVFHHLQYSLLKNNGLEKQRFIAMGEFAELITAVSDYFSRPEREENAEAVIDEIFDAETQIEAVKIMLHAQYPELYNELRRIRRDKTRKLLLKYAEKGVSSYRV